MKRKKINYCVHTTAGSFTGTMYKKSRKAEKSVISIPNQDVQCLYEERQPRPPKRKRGQRSKKFYMTMHDFVTDSAWLGAARFSISSKHNSNTLPEWVHQPKFRSKNESHKPTLMFSFALVSTKAALFSFASLSPLAASTWRLYIDQYHVRKKSNSREIFKRDFCSSILVEKLDMESKERDDPPGRRKITFRPYDDARNVAHTTKVDNLVVYNLYHIKRTPWRDWIYKDIAMDTNGILWVNGWIFILDVCNEQAKHWDKQRTCPAVSMIWHS